MINKRNGSERTATLFTDLDEKVRVVGGKIIIINEN